MIYIERISAPSIVSDSGLRPQPGLIYKTVSGFFALVVGMPRPGTALVVFFPTRGQRDRFATRRGYRYASEVSA